ncbi:hypothetical protein LTR84_004495 [Exophiala bonariae]|uniref:Uncharacterized protein n=1 Tax=Exophiala bonariae TaxID=1690606 RepID=A0AAV9N7Q1_9EURO|nr:hypothetical protein LTR84_004495 [Exophiala bonariae]
MSVSSHTSLECSVITSALQNELPSVFNLDQELGSPKLLQQNPHSMDNFALWAQIDADMNMMDFFSELPGMDYQSWAHGCEGLLGNTISAGPTSASMQVAIDIMKTHFQKKNRAATSLAYEARQWASAPPWLELYDKDVLNVFLNLAKKHLSHLFPGLLVFEATRSTEPELILAMAAVGGSFCSVEGSHRVAGAMYNDARRLVYAKVRMLTKLHHKYG